MTARLRRLWARITRLMDDRPDGGYSSISPRRPDGTHGPVFPYNSYGDSR